MKTLEFRARIKNRKIEVPEEILENLASDKDLVVTLSLYEKDEEAEEREWLQFISKNPAFDDLKHPGEDLYTIEDGEPIEL
jgi:hypothetical protein